MKQSPSLSNKSFLCPKCFYKISEPFEFCDHTPPTLRCHRCQTCQCFLPPSAPKLHLNPNPPSRPAVHQWKNLNWSSDVPTKPLPENCREFFKDFPYEYRFFGIEDGYAYFWVRGSEPDITDRIYSRLIQAGCFVEGVRLRTFPPNTLSRKWVSPILAFQGSSLLDKDGNVHSYDPVNWENITAFRVTQCDKHPWTPVRYRVQTSAFGLDRFSFRLRIQHLYYDLLLLRHHLPYKTIPIFTDWKIDEWCTCELKWLKDIGLEPMGSALKETLNFPFYLYLTFSPENAPGLFVCEWYSPVARDAWEWGSFEYEFMPCPNWKEPSCNGWHLSARVVSSSF